MADTTIVLTETAAPVSAGERTPHVRRYTAHDAQERIMRYLGSGPGKATLEDARMAILDAYREITTIAQWSYLWAVGRLNLNGVYNTGTVAYDHTGGTYENMLTLTTGTWPEWSRLGRVVINSVSYKPLRRISDSILVLDSVANPGADVASSTAYTLVKDTYELPTDFWATDGPNREQLGQMTYIRPAAWASRIRSLPEESGLPRRYTLTGQDGRLTMQISPPADSDQTIDFLYLRKPRELNVWDYKTGTATVNTGTFPRRVTLTDGTFSESMVGSVIRLSSTVEQPTGYEGSNPPAEERTIKVLVSSTQAEVDDDFENDYAAMGYRISDPIDLEDLQLNAFWRCIEKHTTIARIMQESRGDAEQSFWQAVRLAKEADNRILERRSAGDGVGSWLHWRHLPMGDDVE